MDIMRRGRRPSNLSTVTSDHLRTEADQFQCSTNISDSEQPEIGEEEYPINCILDETRTKYLIDWEGPYSPTWEPKACANNTAIEVWEEKKKKRDILAQGEAPKKKRQNRRRLLSSSPEAGVDNFTTRAPTDAGQGAFCHGSSPLFVPREVISDTQEETERASGPSISAITSESSFVGDDTVGLDGCLSTPVTDAPSFDPAFVNLAKIDSGELTGSISSVISDTQTENGPAGLSPSDSALESPNILETSEPAQGFQVHNNSNRVPRVSSPVSLSPRKVDEVAEQSLSVLEAIDYRNLPSKSAVDASLTSHPNRSKASELPLELTSQASLGSCTIPESQTGLTATQPNTIADAAFSGVDLPSKPSGEPARSTLSPAQGSQRFPPLGSDSLPLLRRSQDSPLPGMDDQTVHSNFSSLSEVLEKYSHIPGSTPREKLRNAHAQLSASASIRPHQPVNIGAVPSQHGDVEPSQVSLNEREIPSSVPVGNTNFAVPIAAGTYQPTSEPLTAPPPLQEAHPGLQTVQLSALTASNVGSHPPGSVQLGQSEFALTLPMDSRVKDDYETALANEVRVIRNFLTTFSSTIESTVVNAEEDQIVSKVQRLIEKLDNISVHPDLNMAEHVKNTDPDPGKEATWAEYSSSKFQFLGHLSEIASSHNFHIIIMVKRGKTMEMLERYFLGKGFAYSRLPEEMHGNVEVSMIKGPLSFGIHATENDGIVETYKQPSIIIALDSSFSPNQPFVEHLRTTYARHGNLLPIIWLLVSNSSEHIRRCLPNTSHIQKLRLLIYHITLFQDVVGDLQDDALGVHEDAEELLSYLLSDNFDASWSLAVIEPLNILAFDEIPTTEFKPNSKIRLPISSVRKHELDGDETDVPTPKRQRVTPAQEPGQLTESSKNQNENLDTESRGLGRGSIRMRNSHSSELNTLETMLPDVQVRLLERERILESLQHRYESRTKELHQLRREHARLSETLANTEQKIEKQKDEIAKLKDERTQLKHDLEAARSALKEGGGTVAELEVAREETRRLFKENTSFEKKAEYERKQAEYTREQYQNASTMAAQLGIEIGQLKNENEELKHKVEIHASKLKELKISQDKDRHLSRISELETILSSRDDLLRRKEDELREIKKCRPYTRTASAQPRSPKWGPGNSRPTSPGLNHTSVGGRGSGLRFSSEKPS